MPQVSESIEVPAYQVDVLHSIQEVQELGNSWNNLWLRSGTTRPTSRAEFIRTWIDCFAPDAEFRAIIVVSEGVLVAALPLMGRRWAKLMTVGSLPRNEWLASGNLLLDESQNPSVALRLLANTLAKMPWSIFRFPLIPSHESSWVLFRESLLESGFSIASRPAFDVSLVEIATNWKTFESSWSSHHRKKMARMLSRMDKEGGCRLRIVTPRDRVTAEPLLREAFDIEDSGWKGNAGSSVLRTPGMPEFMRRVAGDLADHGELELAFLDFNDEPIAFEFLWKAKRVLHSYKVGYKEKHRHFTPGIILMREILRDMFESRQCLAYDCLGPLSPATTHWRGKVYQECQWTVASPRPAARALMFGYQQWMRRAATPFHPFQCKKLLNRIASGTTTRAVPSQASGME